MRLSKSLCLATVIFCGSALADEYHYKNLLVGTKAIGLGGAFTGISDDLSAVFFNPAGLTNTKNSNSASISTFSWEKTTFHDAFSDGSDFTRSSFSIVPSFLGFGNKTENWHWSVGFGVSDLSTERDYREVPQPILTEDGVQYGEQIEFGNVDLDNSAYNLGLAAATKINSAFSIGGSLIIKYKNFETVQSSGINQIFFLPENTIYSGFIASRRIKDESILAAPVLGLLYQAPAFNIGLKITKDFTIQRDFTATHNIFVSSPTPLPPNTKPATVGSIRGDEKQEYSTNVSLGLAKRRNNFEWSFDIDHYPDVQVEEFIISPEHPPITRDLKQVTNYSLGLTFYKTNSEYFRFGVFTDNSNGDIDTEQNFQRMEDIDMLGLSLDYTSETFGFPLSIGTYLKYGKGKVRLGDLRVVENIVGLPLYPENNNFDISDSTKSLVVIFLSANF